MIFSICGPRTSIVQAILLVTITIVNVRYRPISGMVRLVGGIISTSNRKNTVIVTKIDTH